jgi:hypothetical protein
VPEVLRQKGGRKKLRVVNGKGRPVRTPPSQMMLLRVIKNLRQFDHKRGYFDLPL